uniref:Uncharacterized protein n=1 Tax=Triticum urartu TaxID=4572 RepID=A0A8R7RCG6_TRIUA
MLLFSYFSQVLALCDGQVCNSWHLAHLRLNSCWNGDVMHHFTSKNGTKATTRAQ